MNISGSNVYSVYNIIQTKVLSTKKHNPLGFLEGDKNSGWQVARNLLKPLNHLEFLRKKERIAQELNLHNLNTTSNIFYRNYRLLDDHQKGELATNNFIKELWEQLLQQGKSISFPEINNKLKEYATIRHMEFHPSDVCNLTCKECTYGHDEEETKPLPINFPFDGIGKIAQLKPKSMVIIGGGEPTLYVNQKHRFQEMVDELLYKMPNLNLALVTNGTLMPKGDWPNRFLWTRISLDAASAKTYTNFRGKNFFNKVINNFLEYLKCDIQYVGISFLFAKSNIHEYAKVAEFIFNLVKQEQPQNLHKVNIQYRPLRRDPYDYHKPFAEAISQEQIDKVIDEVKQLANCSIEIQDFLKKQTNITAILGGNTHPNYKFDRCYYSQTFKIIRANGDLRPCFIRVSEPEFLLGNILNDSLEKIALNSLYVGAARKPHCDAHGCRQCHVNSVFEKGLSGELKPSSYIEVQEDPMY